MLFWRSTLLRVSASSWPLTPSMVAFNSSSSCSRSFTYVSGTCACVWDCHVTYIQVEVFKVAFYPCLYFVFHVHEEYEGNLATRLGLIDVLKLWKGLSGYKTLSIRIYFLQAVVKKVGRYRWSWIWDMLIHAYTYPLLELGLVGNCCLALCIQRGGVPLSSRSTTL